MHALDQRRLTRTLAPVSLHGPHHMGNKSLGKASRATEIPVHQGSFLKAANSVHWRAQGVSQRL